MAVFGTVVECRAEFASGGHSLGDFRRRKRSASATVAGSMGDERTRPMFGAQGAVLLQAMGRF